MAEYPESGLDSILQQRLGIADRKAEVLAEASQSKKNLFNPINAGNLEHVDGDTWRLKDSNRTFRAGTGDPSTTIDTFESKIERYEENPDRFRSHRRNYAKLTGKPEFLITKQELVDRGQAQAFKTAQRMEQAATEGRLAFRTTGVDDYGREVAELVDTQTGGNFFSSGAEENASYDSKFNAGQRVKDIFGGVTGERDAFSGGRSAGTAALDQGGNLLSGALNMGNDLLHATSILTGARNQNSDQFFENNRGRIDRVKKYMVSEQQLSREARDGRNAARNEELYDARVDRYMKEDGATERSAKIKAGIQEFGDSVFDLIRNPGRVLDATVESLPYMIGVGFAGKAAVTASTNLIRNSVTKNAIKAGATAEQGAASAARYLSSKSGSKLLKTVATATGVGVVGLTEGLSTSAGVYSSIMGMTEEEAMQSERYQALRLDKGKNHKEALQELAEEAFDNTFITATAVAAGASLLTGAGAFESQLFTRLAGIRKEATGSATKAVAKEGTQRGLVGTAIAGTFKNTGKYAKFVGPAGLKEAAEETIQSGGGEFLSQLAKFEQGLGPEPGAGIGAAAGEGAVVGFASGAGAQTLSGGVKKLANAEVRKSGLDVIQRRKDIKNIVDNSGAPGGSAVAAVDTVTTPEQAAETLKAVEVIQAKGDEKSLAQTVQQFSTIQAAVDKIGEENLNESQKKSYEQARGDYVRNLDKLATDILSRERKTETYTKSESQILQAAMKADAPSVQNLKPDSDMGRAYNHTRRAVEVIKSAQTEAIDNAAIAQESEPNLSSAEAIRVANEKMGAGKSKQGYLGLQGHFNVISEAIAQKDKAAVAERSQRLANFINTQAQKLAKVKKVLDDPAHATQYGIEYKAGATEKYYNVLRSEMEKMVATRNELAGLAGQWMAGDTSVAKVTQVPRKVEVIKSAAAAAATQTQETQEEQETEESENPAPPSRKVAVERAESKGKVVEAKRGKTDDQKSEQAERTDDKSSGADSAAGTDTTADSEADNESSNDTTSAKGTPETSDTQSKSSESSDTESTAANVTREQLEKMPSRAVFNMAKRLGMEISFKKAVNVGEMIDYILDQQTTEKKAQPPPIAKSLKAEVDDVGLVLNLLGLTSEGTSAPTEQNVKRTYNAVRQAMQDGFTKANIEAIRDSLTWVKNKGVKFSEARLERATKRVKDGRVKPENVQAHYGIQLAEEIIEVLVELLGNTTKLQIQKAELKVLRFGANTIIKDGPNKGKTNSQVLEELKGTAATAAAAEPPTVTTAPQEDTPLRKLNGKTQRFTFKSLSGTVLTAVAEWTQRGERWVIARPVGQKTGWTVYHLDTGKTDSVFQDNGTIDETYKNAQFFIEDRTDAQMAKAIGTQLPAAEQQLNLATATKSELVAELSRTKGSNVRWENLSKDQARALLQADRDNAPDTPEITNASEEDTSEQPSDFPLRLRSALYDLNDVDVALHLIATQSTNGLFREIGTRLLDALKGRNITVETLSDKDFVKRVAPNLKNATAAFLPGDQAVILRTSSKNKSHLEQAFLHELIHAALNNWMVRPKTTAEDKQLHNRANNVRNAVLKYLDKKRSEDPNNPEWEAAHRRLAEHKEEFITYAWTNPQIQAILKKIPYSGGTLFSRFVSTVAEILGVSGNTALREILQVGDEIVNRNKGEQGRTAKQGEVYIPEVLPTEGEIQAAEAEARAQAEAEPERSAGAEAEGPSAEKLARNNIYWDVLAEVKRLQTWLAEGKITEEQVGFVDAKFNKWYGTRLQGNTAAGALAQMETSINEALDHSIPRTPISTEGLNLDAALAAAASLAKTGSTEAPAIEPEQAGFESFDTEASWPRLKRWLLGSPPAAVIKTKVAAAFKKLGLPVSIASGFTQASKTAKSLITAVPNLHEILANPLARRALYDTLELKPDEEIAFEAFRSFRSEFAQAASKAYQSLIDNKFAEDRLTDNPAYLLTDLSDTMDPQALTAMAYESMNWLVSDGQSLFNDDDAIRDILGLDDNASPTINQRKLQTAGTLRRNIVDSLGQSAWKHLNLSAKQSADISPNLQERMESALGTIMIRSLMITQPSSQRDAGRIEAVSFDGSLFESMKGDGVTVHEDYSKPVNFIRIKPYGDRGSDRFYQTDANADLQDAVRPGRTVFQRVFGVSSMVKEPLLTVPTDENIPKRALRSLTKLSKKMTAAFKYQQEIPWETDNQMIDVLKRFNKEDFLAFSHEYNPDLGSVHSTELESVEGRNRTLETAFDNALKWARDNGDKDFYMTYAMTRTGRVNIASTFINPQASKIHRFLFRQKAWTETVEAGDTRMIENFKIAVGLGMGIKVDKLTREDALAAIDALMNSDLVTDALEQIATEGDINLQGEGNALAELLGEEGTHTLAALVAWQTHLDAHGGPFTVSLPMEVDGVTNGFAAGLLQTPPTDPEAIERLKGLLRATGVLFTDDTVNSFPQWLKDANNQDNYQTAAKKMALAIRDMFPGGSLAPDPKSREPGDLAAMVISENMDVILNSGFGPTEQDLRDPKVGRDFAKNPLMIVAYGASSRTVAANLVEKIMQDVYTQLAATNKMTINSGETETQFRERHAEAMLKVMNSAVDVMNVGQESFFARMGWSSNNRLKRYYDKEDLGRMIKRKQFESLDDLAQNFEFEGEHDIRNFETAMKATYGRSIEVALSDMLRGIKEIRNTYTQTITLMNAIFKVEFERRTDIERRSTGRVVGRRRRREILEQMMKEGLVPSIATAYSKSLEENLELTAYEHKTLENEKIKIHFPKNTGVTRRHFDKDGQLNLKEDTSSMTSTLTTRTPSTDVGVAGIVGTIHSLDGTNSADIFGSYDVLNMFDAWLMRLSDMDTVPLKGNDRFFNQHAEYDMGQELNKSLERMMALMATGEGRLSSNAQAEVGKLFVAELKAHNGWGPELQENFVLGQDADGNDIIDYDGVIKYFAFSMASTVQNVTAAKAELFKQIARVNQFSHDENSYEVSDKERSRPLPTIEQAEEYGRDKAATEKITAKAQTLARNLEEDGNFSDAFFNWIQEEIPRPQEVLRTLTTLIGLVNGPGGSGESLQQLARVLHNYLDNSNPIIVGTLPKGFLGQYQNGQIIIDKSQFTEANNPIETLLHEIVHAATDSALTEIEESNPELLLELVAEARKFQARLAAKKTLSPGEQTVLHALKTQKDHVILVGEYMAYTQTTLSDEPGNLGLLFGTNVGLVDAFTAVGRVVSRGNSQNLRLRSSQDKVNNKLFDTVEEQKLEAEKLWDNFEAMRELDSNTEVAPTGRYREHIQALMEEVLIPGLSSLGRDTYLQLAVETDGTKNIGDFVERGSDKNTLRVQAAGAKLTNNGDMSNQEVFAHELTHAVTGYALARDTKVRAEMRKIFDSVKDRITWEDFMPPANEIAGSQAAVEAAAKARYNYIFGIGQDKSHDALQEFATIGLTNEAFALALTKLDAPSATTPIWDGNILSSILNLINRGLELLRSETLGTRKALNAHDAIFKLAQRIVTINQQGQARKYDKDGHKALWRNASDTKTGELVTKALDVLQEKLRATDDATRQKGGFTGLIRAGTHAALASRTEGQQQVWNKFQRHLGVNKSGDLAQAISEVLPYNKDDRGGADGKMGFIDLLRHSKVNIDIARQRAIEHSRRVLLEAFDPKRRMQRAERIAMTNVLLKTDLVSLMEHNENRTLHDLQQMLGNEQLVDAEINRLMRELNSEMAQQKLPPALMTMYERQMNSLANYMIHSQMTEVNGMKNTHNIVNQFNLLDAADRIQVRDAEKLTALVDQLISLKALKLVERRDVDNALKVINHEMEREEDNGFLYTMGMYSNFKKSSAKDLFNNNPTQMRKGYVYEITNGDVNVEVIIDSAEERQRMHDLGMSEIGIVERDPRDKSTGSRRVLYKGYRGANTWQKSTVSLTDIHRQGQNLFAVSGYDPKATAFALGRMKVTANQEALKQFKQGAIDPRDTIAIPIVDDHGVIVDYTYEMSTANKQQHLKNTQHNDYFDQVLPRMFGSITDRVESSKTNDQVAGLLRKEYEAFKDSDEHNFVFVGKSATNPRAKEMWALLPDGMKRELNRQFRGTEFKDGFPIRDEAVNLVLGFRKLSILDIPGGNGKKLIRGKNATFAARTAERIWQELMQLVRIKMAIINPQVVAGNLSSNFGILLAEGIPVKYITSKTSEAIRSMRQYQRDIRRIDELQRHIGVFEASRRPTEKLVAERERLKAEIRKNPVGNLVQEGLFTSIVEDMSSDEDTYREWLVGSLLDKLKGPLPAKAVSLAKEAYMVPGSTAFNMAIAATQYGDFIGRYIKYKYDTEVKKIDKHDAIHRALASFIYYDMPQNRWLQLMNDNGFMMFSKFFLRIQPVVARLFQENPLKATGVLAAQAALMSPLDENIGTFALFQGAGNRFEPLPFRHLAKLDPTDPSLFQWFWPLGL